MIEKEEWGGYYTDIDDLWPMREALFLSEDISICTISIYRNTLRGSYAFCLASVLLKWRVQIVSNSNFISSVVRSHTFCRYNNVSTNSTVFKFVHIRNWPTVYIERRTSKCDNKINAKIVDVVWTFLEIIRL